MMLSSRGTQSLSYGRPNDNVKVILRTKPSGNFADENLTLNPQTGQVDVYIPKTPGLHVNNQQERWSFQFDDILHNASQEIVYEKCAMDMVDSALTGYNSTIMTYGQTGAGKTFTMTGSLSVYKQRGIIPRSLHTLFNYITARPDMQYELSASYIEVYNDIIRDLLDSNCKQLSESSIHEDSTGMVTIKGLTKVPIADEEQALACVFRGEANRTVAAHESHPRSSRSHCIFSIYISAKSMVESTEKSVYSKLTFVDLAGSERVGKTGSGGNLLAEAKSINKSLAFLEQVVVALAAASNVPAPVSKPGEGTFIDTAINLEHVPFRRSRLTNVLRDSIGGKCKTRLIANICTERENIEETISTLRFASRMSLVKSNAVRIEAMDTNAYVSKLERQVRDLEAELALYTSLQNKAGGAANMSLIDQQDVAKNVRLYVNGVIPELPIASLQQIQETFKQFKLFAQSLMANGGAAANEGMADIGSPVAVPADAGNGEDSARDKENTAAAASGAKDTGKNARKGKSANSRRATVPPKVSTPTPEPVQPQPVERGVSTVDVGVVVGGHGVSVGTAPTNARPNAALGLNLGLQTANGPNRGSSSRLGSSGAAIVGNTGVAETPRPQQPLIVGNSGASPLAGLVSGRTLISGTHVTSAPSQDVAFQWFRSNHPTGISLNNEFNQGKLRYMDVRGKLNTVIASLNHLKSEIDNLNGVLAGKPGQAAEYNLLKELREKKERYSECMDLRASANAAVEEQRVAVDNAKNTLAKAFLEYYTTTYGHALSNNGLTSPFTEEKKDFGSDILSDMASASPSMSRNTGENGLNSAPSSDALTAFLGDALDVGEQFDRLQLQKLAKEDPGAIHFFNAKKMAMESQRGAANTRSMKMK